MKPMEAKELMNKGVAYVSPTMSVLELATYLDDQGIHGAPVQDSTGNLVGVVSRSDVNRAIGESLAETTGTPSFHTVNEDGDYEDMPTDIPADNPAEDMTVAEIMSSNAVTATSDRTAGEIAKLMIDESCSRVLLTESNKVVGIISTTDLLAAVVRYEGAD